MARGGKIRLLIADDNAAYRCALLGILRGCPGLEVVGEATNGEDAILQSEELQPAIVLMDINMPKLDGIGATRRIKALDNEVKVIGLSVHSDQYHKEAMIDAGATELLPKENVSHDLYGAIQRAMTRSDHPPSAST